MFDVFSFFAVFDLISSGTGNRDPLKICKDSKTDLFKVPQLSESEVRKSWFIAKLVYDWLIVLHHSVGFLPVFRIRIDLHWIRIRIGNMDPKPSSH
jgi:hypothetical protein